MRGQYAGFSPPDLVKYSTNSKEWTKMDAASGPIARYGHAMGTVDEDIYLFGGWTSASGNVGRRWRREVRVVCVHMLCSCVSGSVSGRVVAG